MLPLEIRHFNGTEDGREVYTAHRHQSDGVPNDSIDCHKSAWDNEGEITFMRRLNVDMPARMKEDEFYVWAEKVNWVYIGQVDIKEERQEVWMTPGGCMVSVSIKGGNPVKFVPLDAEVNAYSYMEGLRRLSR